MKGLAQLYRKFFPETLVSFALNNLSNNSGIILMYHEVQPDSFELPAWTVVKESDFKWQMEYLSKRFDIISIDDGFDRVYRRKKGKKPFAIITFDDGYKGNLDIVLPFMEKKGLPFIIYVATRGTITNNLFWYDRLIFNILNCNNEIHLNIKYKKKIQHLIRIHYNVSNENRWEQIENLLCILKKMTIFERKKNVKNILKDIDNGINEINMLNKNELKKISKSSCVAIGNHTHSHELLDKLNQKDIQVTINKARENIWKITGSEPLHFSYPNGDYNCVVTQILEKCGYHSAVTTKNGLWKRETNRFNLPRLSIGRFESKQSFKAIISRFL